jgi:transposase
MGASSTLFKKTKPGLCLAGAVYCRNCYERQLRIDALEEEVTRLKAKLGYRDNKEKEAYVGSSTPSSKKPFKSNASGEQQKKQCGGVNGHAGHSRVLFTSDEADEIIDVKPFDEVCPDCGGSLELKVIDERAVVEGELLKPKKVLFRCHTKRCVDCRKVLSRAAPVLPRHKYGSQFLSNALIMHYVHGIPMKRVEALWGSDVVSGNLIKNFHELSGLFEGLLDRIKQDYRTSAVRHADETGWRTDGDNGYGWLFSSADTSIFCFERTRASSVVVDMLGKKRLPGVLVVDRYAAYNKAPCALQYWLHVSRQQ